MRAIIQNTFGGPEVLEVVDIGPPRPLPTEVVVRVHAVGINPIEPVIRAGHFPLLGDPPFVLGWDVSGVVEHATPDTWRFQPGDEVFGMPFFPRAANGYAEYIAAPARHLARKPASLDHVHAAALPLVGLTAWQGLVDLAGLQAGQRVLIHGAGGGVGHVAVQLAKVLGAHVIATASAGKHDFVASLGADELIDYRAVDFTTAVGDLDVVFDPVGGDYGERSLRVLRPGGALVSAVDRTNAELAARAEAAGMRFAGVAVDPDHAALERLADLVEDGRLRVHVERTFPLERVAEAHRLSEGGHVTGKVVLTVR
jgi:NADPH:quinone reductase-like Zn-dependent oxidoreductase